MPLDKVNRVLKRNVTDESIAYGYTLAIWGSGALLIQFLQLNPARILAYVGGGVAGFALMASIVFSDMLGDVYNQAQREKMIVASMIHVLASFGSVVLSYVFIMLLVEKIDPLYLFFLIGLHATVTYNIMLVIEEFISVELYNLEQNFLE